MSPAVHTGLLPHRSVVARIFEPSAAVGGTRALVDLMRVVCFSGFRRTSVNNEAVLQFNPAVASDVPASVLELIHTWREYVWRCKGAAMCRLCVITATRRESPLGADATSRPPCSLQVRMRCCRTAAQTRTSAAAMLQRYGRVTWCCWGNR